MPKLNEALENYAQHTTEILEDLDTIRDVRRDVVTLESISNIIDAAEHLSPDAARISAIVTESIYARLGLRNIAAEGIGDVVKRVGSAIKKGLSTITGKKQDLLKEHKEVAKEVTYTLSEVKRKIQSLSGTPKEQQFNNSHVANVLCIENHVNFSIVQMLFHNHEQVLKGSMEAINKLRKQYDAFLHADLNDGVKLTKLMEQFIRALNEAAKDIVSKTQHFKFYTQVEDESGHEKRTTALSDWLANGHKILIVIPDKLYDGFEESYTDFSYVTARNKIAADVVGIDTLSIDEVYKAENLVEAFIKLNDMYTLHATRNFNAEDFSTANFLEDVHRYAKASDHSEDEVLNTMLYNLIHALKMYEPILELLTLKAFKSNLNLIQGTLAYIDQSAKQYPNKVG